MTITFETVIVAGIAMGAATGVMGLVGYDLLHSPTPYSRYLGADAAAGHANGVTAEHARPGSVDRSVEGVERQARVVHDFSNLTIFRVITTWLGGREYSVTSGYIYQSIHSDMPERQFCYLMVPRSGSTFLRINLADKANPGGVVTSSLGEPDAESAELPLDVLNDSKRSCRWL
ncbi:MAG: hypothetical protein WA864_08020 [Acetobacteraceae bacterium]|jgi:hypothetical protein